MNTTTTTTTTTAAAKRSSTLYMVELAMMIAIILLMSFTPLGYLRTPGLSITLLTIPVAVGAIILAPEDGADDHLELLRETAELFSDAEARETLLKASTPVEVCEFLTHWETAQTAAAQ